MVITNEILLAFVHCQFKAYKKNKGETGIISEYEMLYVQLRKRQKLNFFNPLTENKNLITWDSTDKTFVFELFYEEVSYVSPVQITLNYSIFTGCYSEKILKRFYSIQLTI